jgi:hypothetical protein
VQPIRELDEDDAMSSTIASSILRKFSACRSSLDENGSRRVW